MLLCCFLQVLIRFSVEMHSFTFVVDVVCVGALKKVNTFQDHEAKQTFVHLFFNYTKVKS